MQRRGMTGDRGAASQSCNRIDYRDTRDQATTVLWCYGGIGNRLDPRQRDATRGEVKAKSYMTLSVGVTPRSFAIRTAIDASVPSRRSTTCEAGKRPNGSAAWSTCASPATRRIILTLRGKLAGRG